jgi:hypothetical protein
MGKKSALSIEDDIYNTLVDVLPGIIKGALYKKGTRPLDSSSEDAVIAISGGDSEQIQTIRAHINIYVPDINNGTGNLVEDKTRLKELADHDETIVEALNNALFEEYSFRLYKLTDSFAEPDMKQHFVNVNLEIERITF